MNRDFSDIPTGKHTYRSHIQKYNLCCKSKMKVSPTTIREFLKDVELKEMAAYNDSPLISLLKDDDGISPEQRHVKLRSLVKSAGMFAMNFKVLNNEVLSYPADEAKTHKLKAAISRHCKEDGNHWPFWCHDNEALGLNVETKVNDVYRYAFGNETKVSRSDVALVSKWIGKHGDSPYARYVLISLVELHGDLLFGVTLPIVHKWEEAAGKRLDYFGDKHRDREIGTLMHQDETVMEEAANHELTSDELKACEEARTMICESINIRWDVFAKSMERDLQESAQ